ncbi:MAG: hypothetical protein HY954_04535 [Deltaproteobacteria bacterium]|nr:hypothetical protein [Deltaproteobacteria bacterium]
MVEAFGAVSRTEADELYGNLIARSLKTGFTYQRAGGKVEAIHLMLVPAFFTAEQVSYLSALAHAVKRGVEAAYRAWFDDSEIAALLPFEEDEEKWIRAARSGSKAAEPLWYRLDSHFNMKEKAWKDSISIFEINGCAVGGIHYGPAAEHLFFDTVMPLISKYLPELPLIGKSPDLRELLYLYAARQAKLIGRNRLNFIFCEDNTADEGITEGPYIVEFLKGIGCNAELADPRELHIKKDEVWFKDTPVDIIYRNFELRDILEMEREGGSMEALRLAFFKNQAISSLCGDFDHKSMWEVLTSGRFDKYFNEEDAKLFKKHLLWTRTLKEGMTTGPCGEPVDLMPYTARNKDGLVLKPNRLCGGYGVTIGRTSSEADWEASVSSALKGGEAWVVQRFSEPEGFKFPLFEDGSLAFEDHNIVYGLSATPDGTGILGRASRQNVVNVAQQGGLMPVLRLAEGGGGLNMPIKERLKA